MRRSIAAGAVAAALLAAASGANAGITVLTTPQPPYVGEDGKQGIVIALARTLFERAGVEATFVKRPKARAIAQARKEAGHCALPVQRTPDLMVDFGWVSPVFVNRLALFDASPGPDYRALADAADKRIGVVHGGASEAHLDGLSFELNTRRVPSVEHGIKMLKAGRIDVLAADTVTAAHIADRMGRDIHRRMIFETTLRGLACNKAVADETLATMQDALNAMYAEGTVEAIVNERTAGLAIEGARWYE